MSKFKIGDRVKEIGLYKGYGYGTVIADEPTMGVRFDKENIQLHSCDGKCEAGHGWWCNDEYVQLISQYQVGDKVKIRSDLVDEKYYGFSMFNPAMRKYVGRVGTIDMVDTERDVFMLDIGGSWSWTAEMVEPVIEIEKVEEVEEKKIGEERRKMSVLEEEIVEKVMPYFKKKIQKEFKDITKGITTVAIKINEEEVKEKTVQAHKQFTNLLTLVSNKIPAMLTGPAGSGKTGTCEKVADVLGLDYYFSNAITQEYKLTGFIDANGTYKETQFYKAFKNGGLFVLDEIDASVPEALVILNTAIANGYFDFPNGKIEAHKDFRVVACANTYGLGADDIYVGRYQLDGASLDRFAVVEFQYDTNLENSLVEDQDWASFVQTLRERIKEKKLRHIISMRATIYGDTLIKAEMPIEDIFKQIIFKNLKVDDIKTLGNLSGSKNKYIKLYNTYIANDCRMPEELPF